MVGITFTCSGISPLRCNNYCKPLDQFKASEFNSSVSNHVTTKLKLGLYEILNLNELKQAFLMLSQTKGPKKVVSSYSIFFNAMVKATLK